MSVGKGKISRLPFEIRQELNHRMRNGERDLSLVAWLNGLPEVKAALADAEFGGGKKARPKITPQNLSEYRAGMYQHWVKDQEKVERVQTLAEFSTRLAAAAGGTVAGPAVSIAAGRMMELLEAAEGDDLLNISMVLSKLQTAEANKIRAGTDRERLGIQQKVLALEEQKFRRTTAELFLKWYADKRAVEIAESGDKKDVKMDSLITLMFGKPNEGKKK